MKVGGVRRDGPSTTYRPRRPQTHASTVRTFLIADVRGYTRFTREHGDAQAARLAGRFADLARDAVEARGGRVIELRGDEALAVFGSSRQAVRAALDFQAICEEEVAADPSLPLIVGIGIDVGEAVPVEDGFRGVALNTAARLCSKATAGEILVTRSVVELAGSIEEIRFEERGPAELKGFEETVEMIAAVAAPQRAALPAPAPTAVTAGRDAMLPLDLDTITPLIEREHEMHWLRGTWRQARRGRGRVVFVSGRSQIGKTRLAAELASEVGAEGARIRYAGPGGAAAALAMRAIRDAMDARSPTVLIVDDLDLAGQDVARALAEAHDEVRSRPVLVIALVEDPGATPALDAMIEEADQFGDGHLPLTALDTRGVEGIARFYAGAEVQDLPLETMVRASGGVPGRVHEVASEWARNEAGRRLAAAAEWLAEGRDRRSADLAFANNVIGLKLERLYGTVAPVADGSGCPYKGLASFEETDAAYFFGRERLVAELAARTVQVGLLGLVGASGSGKSSVVAAGLIPSLRAGLLPGSERWRSVVFRPGEHPMAELTAALSSGVPGSDDGDGLEGALEMAGPGERLVVAVDQFEEAFTLCDDDDERAGFIQTITRAATRRHERIVFVLTIRDDFYGGCASHRELAELFAANHVLVPPMTRDELRRVIELPARRARFGVESALTDALVEEVAEEPGGLPLLSAALVELWQAREDGWLRAGAYERTAGVHGAVARLAEASYGQLTDAERDIARRTFLRLAGTGEGDAVTRRRVPLSELEVDTNPAVSEVLGCLTQDRLLTISDSTVEVAHEALLREWPRLRGWLDDDLQGHQLRQHLTQAAKQWSAAGRDVAEVYRGARLSTALDWSSTRGRDLNELERDFLAEGRRATEHETERQRRTNRRLRGLLAGMALFLVVALVAGGLALVQRGHAERETQRAEQEAQGAERQARIASARELAAAAVANLDVDPELSILLAREAVDATWGPDGATLPEAEEALHRALIGSRVIRSVPEGGAVAVSPDGTRFVTGTSGTPEVWDMATGTRLLMLHHRGFSTGVAYSPGGDRLVSSGWDGTVRLWDAATGDLLEVLSADGTSLRGLSFDPDGARIVASADDGTLRIWDVATAEQVHVLRGPAREPFVAPGHPVVPVFSPDGSLVASGGWGTTATVWDVATGRIAAILTGHDSRVSAVDFSPAGTALATTSPDGSVKLWDPASGDLITTFSGSTAEQFALDYSPDGSRIATGGTDGAAVVWDASTGEQVMTLSGHSAEIIGLAFTPDGSALLTGSRDGTTRVWDVTVNGGRDWLTVPGPTSRLGAVVFGPDGSTFAVPADPSGVTIRDTETGDVVMRLTGHDAVLWDLAFSPDGSLLAGAPGAGVHAPGTANRSVPIWDVVTGELLTSLEGHERQVSAVEFAPDGRTVVTASHDGTLRTWDVATASQERVLEVGGGAHALAFSPDGRWLLAGVGSRTAVRVYEASTLERGGRLPGHAGSIQDLAFLGNDRVVSASGDATAKIWSLETLEELMTLRGHTGSVNSVAVHPDGELVATAGADGTAKLWDAATGEELLTYFGHDRGVHTVTFSPDGRFLATASVDGTVALRLLPIDELRSLALERVSRTLTEEECRRYLHVESCSVAP